MARQSLHPVIDGFKTCSKCLTNKSVDCFGIDPRAKSGLRAKCKQCINSDNSKRRADPDVYAAFLKTKADKRRGSGAGRVEVVKQQINAGTLFCEVMQQRTWSKAFRSSQLSDTCRNLRERFKSPDVRGPINLRARRKVAGQSPYTTSPKLGLFGYDYNQLFRHLEQTFTDGMSWDMFLSGDIHIDHIRPLASFNCECPNDFNRAWSIDNLQLMWARDNMAKGSEFNGVKHTFAMNAAS